MDIIDIIAIAASFLSALLSIKVVINFRLQKKIALKIETDDQTILNEQPHQTFEQMLREIDSPSEPPPAEKTTPVIENSVSTVEKSDGNSASGIA